MKIAALTHVWNEADNLPIWISYYGKIFGKENLYVLDHGSDDGSTANLGPVNVVRFPHTPFDDNQKALAVSNLHRTLIQYFDCVLVSDCDEIIAPDPAKYLNLWQYIEKTQPTSVVCIGLHLQQILDRETSLALTRPILSQRQFAFFSTPSSKPLISSVPTRWLGRGHASSVVPALDTDLFVFHIKFMDYTFAMRRHALNVANEFSASQQEAKHGLHHKYGHERFFKEAFLGPMNAVRNDSLQPFSFENEIAVMRDGIAERDGIFILGVAEPKFVQIPDRFRDIF